MFHMLGFRGGATVYTLQLMPSRVATVIDACSARSILKNGTAQSVSIGFTLIQEKVSYNGFVVN